MSEGEKLTPQETGMCPHGNFLATCSLCNEVSEKSEKDRIWERTSQEIEQIGDKLGKGIDDGVKESVIALTVNEYPTVQSCEGHLDEKGLSYPWVQVEAPAPEGWEEDDIKKQEWTEANLHQRERMTTMLKEFYLDREEDNDSHLILADQGIYEAFRLQSAGGEVMDSLSRIQQEEKQKMYRKEMKDFTDFLRQQFEQENTDAELRERINKINELKIGNAQKADIILVVLGFKPATELSLYENNDSESTVINALEQAGLKFEPKDPSEYSKNVISEFKIALDSTLLDRLTHVSAKKDHTEYGRLMGYPESAVQAFGKKDALLDEQDYPDMTGIILPLKLSKENWEDELKYLRKGSEAIKKYTPELYDELVGDEK
jgi:hypothetical protein